MWFVYGTDKEKRQVCGPRVARALTGRAKEIVSGMGEKEILKVASADGCEFLLKYILDQIGDPVVTEVAEYLEELFTKFQRSQGESMGAYIARFERLYAKMKEALGSMKAPAAEGTGPEVVEEWLPEIVRGWLLLSRSGLSEGEQAAVVGSSSNSYKYTDLASALKLQWPEKRIKEHDRTHYQPKRVGGSQTFGYTIWNEEETEDEDLFHVAEQEIEEGEVIIPDFTEEEAYEAMQGAARTWVKARTAMRKAKTSRGFYDKSGENKFQGNCLRCGRFGHRARDCNLEKGKGKGKGKGGKTQTAMFGSTFTETPKEIEFSFAGVKGRIVPSWHRGQKG